MAKRIDVKDLDIYYGDFKAVEGVTLTVEPRSVTAFIGPSGCGKSTVLRTLNRMHEVIPGGRVDGKVTLDDQDLYASSMDPVAVRRTVGMVFQRPNPFPTMSIRDNVAAGLKAQRHEEQEAGSTRSSSARSRAPTSGTRSRTGSTSPAPASPVASSSDSASPAPSPSTRRCSSWTSRARRSTRSRRWPSRTSSTSLKSQYTVVIVTHNMQQAARVSDQTAFFNLKATGQPGRLVEVDDTQRIFSNPTQKATEDYISGRFG